MSEQIMSAAVLTPATFLSHWKGHRALTRRVIEAFPEDQLFSFSIGEMRPFGALVREMYGVAAYNLRGLVADDWENDLWKTPLGERRADLLAAWDELTAEMDAGLPGVPPSRYDEVRTLPWGTMPVWVAAIYAVDNEIHHRGQGYVYLRALGIEPPAFYER